MTKKRDNKYYEGLLKRKDPIVHADWKAGRIPNLAQALVKAHIKKKPSALMVLQKTWAKASKVEQDAFRSMISATRAPSATPAPTTLAPIFKSNGRLEKWAITRITDFMTAHRLQHGQIMRALGFKALDPNLGNVLSDTRSGNPAFRLKLEAWYHKNCT